MSDLNLENQNTAEHQTELIATGSDPNQLGRLFPDGVVLQVKPGANTVGDFDGIQGIAGGTGNGVRGDADATGAGVRGESHAATGFGFGVFGLSVSPTGAGVSGRNDAGAGVSGFSISGNAFNGTSVTNDGVVGISNSAGKSGVLGFNTTPSHQSFSFGVFGFSSQGIGVGGRTDNFIGVHGVCVNNDQGNPGAGVKGDNEQNGAGVAGTSVNGDGVVGSSNGGRGGVFASARSAQLRLVPADNPTPGLPRAGQFGDVYVRLTGGEGTETIEMFLCVIRDGRGDLNDPAFWAPFQFGPVVPGG